MFALDDIEVFTLKRPGHPNVVLNISVLLKAVERGWIPSRDTEIAFPPVTKALPSPEGWRVERLCEPYLSQPLLLVEVSPAERYVVDGLHRATRAKRDGRKSLAGKLVHWKDAQNYVITNRATLDRIRRAI